MSESPGGPSAARRLADVARAAPVSLTTASHAFTGNRPVKPETRRRIYEAALELGYIHEPGPRGTTISIIVRPPEASKSLELGSTSFPGLVGAVALAALARKFYVTVADDVEDAPNHNRSTSAFLLLNPLANDPALKYLIDREIPVATLDPSPGVEHRHWIGAAYAEAVRVLVRQLHTTGAERISLLAGKTDNQYSRSVVEAFTSEAGRCGVFRSVTRYAFGSSGAAEIRADMTRFLSHTKPDAVVTSSAVLARLLIDAAAESGLSVPGDVQVASVIDGDPAVVCRTPITAFHPDTNWFAHELLRIADACMQGREAPGAGTLYPLKLVQRQSTLNSRVDTAGS